MSKYVSTIIASRARDVKGVELRADPLFYDVCVLKMQNPKS